MCRFNSLKSCKETFSVPSEKAAFFFLSLYLSSRTFAEVKNARSYTRIGRSKSQHFQQKYIKTLFFQQEIIYLLYKLFF